VFLFTILITTRSKRRHTNREDNKALSDNMTNKRVLVPIANGSEEIETVSIIDTLRRAQIDVTVAKVSGGPNDEQFDNKLQIKASRGVFLVADTDIESVKDQQFDLIALPGGLPGAKAFAQCDTLIEMLKQQKQRSNVFTTAICASPAVVFAPHGILDDVKYATCYPGLKDELEQTINKRQINTQVHNDKVVRSGNVITSQGPGTAIDFALALISVLVSDDKAQEVAKGMLLPFDSVQNKQ
jgi:4-methyl-5(b-hydroxyethyl)-thiazole monophosphate biosynthesis